MALDRKIATQLKKYAQVFKDAKERDANESDTVMYLVKFFEEVLDYNSLKGEISKEVSVKDRFCDIALKIDGEIELLIEAKSAGQKNLTSKHIEQAENYASRSGLSWVLLTNGIHWQLYHISFIEGEGIRSDLAFEVEFNENNLENFWEHLSMLTKKSINQEKLEAFWTQKKALKPSVVLKALFSQDVMAILRRELNRQTDVRLDIEDIFESIKNLVSKESLMDAGDLVLSKKRKRKKKTPQVQESSNDTIQAEAPPSKNVA